VFGMGGEMLQTPNRDTLKFAMKASAIKGGKMLNGLEAATWRGVSKDPITDPGKKSKTGRLGVLKDENGYRTVSEVEANGSDLLETVWVDGKTHRLQTFDEIRALSNQ